MFTHLLNLNVNTLTNTIKKYLYKNNIFINDESITLHLYSNPNFPSLKAISDTFDYFNISNITANVPKEALKQLPVSFLAVVNNKQQDEVVMVTCKKNKIKIDGQSTQKTISYQDFLNIWTGTIIAVEENNSKTIVTSKGIVYLTMFAVLSLLLQLLSLNAIFSILSILALAGVFLAFLIVREEAGVKSIVVKKVCNSVNNNGGCDKVISSSDSKIFGFISLSNASAAYFVSQLLAINLLGLNFNFFFVFSLLGLPVIFYSLYSQAFRLKQWCVLCLGVSTLFFIQLIIFSYIFYINQPDFDLIYFVKASLIMLLVYTCIDYMKAYFSESNKLKREQLELYKLKKDLKVFRAILGDSRAVDVSIITKTDSISFGGENPVLEINAVTNPTCGFCQESFMVYYKLLKDDYDRIRVNFIFNVPFEDQNNISTKIAAKAISLYFENDKIGALEMLNDWYTKRDMDDWLRSYNDSTAISMRINQLFTAHRSWAGINQIQYTPATIVNGYIFPDSYKIEDLLLFANDLIFADEEEKKKTPVMVNA